MFCFMHSLLCVYAVGSTFLCTIVPPFQWLLVCIDKNCQVHVKVVWDAVLSLPGTPTCNYTFFFFYHSCEKRYKAFCIFMIAMFTLWSGAAWERSYRIAGNFREVHIFAIFATHGQNAKIRTAKYKTVKIWTRELLEIFTPCVLCASLARSGIWQWHYSTISNRQTTSYPFPQDIFCPLLARRW